MSEHVHDWSEGFRVNSLKPEWSGCIVKRCSTCKAEWWPGRAEPKEKKKA